MTDQTREQLPAHTTPTWEMELLVSGATIFGLLQLPGFLDRSYYRAVNLSSEAYASLLMPLWLYAKVAVVTLLLTFLLHLCLRGFWVALVGMSSAFPGGVRWDRLGLGPIARERFAVQGDPIPAAIERADNRATRVFGVGFGFAMMMLLPLVLVVLAIVLSLLLGAVLGKAYPMQILLALVALAVLPWALASVLDRRFGERLGQRPAWRRAIGGVAEFYGRRGFGPPTTPLMALFVSHAGRPRFVGTAIAVILPVALVIVMQAAFARGQTPLGFRLAVSGKQTFSPFASPGAFYADQRSEAWTLLPLPYIPSRVVEGPYLELFIPFIARRHDAALQHACPAALGRGQDHRARLQCLASMTAIQLDGKAVAVPLLESTDPVTGQPGLLAMLPVRGLAPGQHELSLSEPDWSPDDDEAPRRYRIPFWR